MSNTETMVRLLAECGIAAEPAVGDPQRELPLGLGILSGTVDIDGTVVRRVYIHLAPDNPNRLFFDFMVPDDRLTGIPRKSVVIDSINHHRFFAFGKVTSVSWRGLDSGLGVRDALNGDAALSEQWIGGGSPDVRVLAHAEDGGFWTISTLAWYGWWDEGVGEFPLFSRKPRFPRVWQCVVALGSALVRS